MDLKMLEKPSNNRTFANYSEEIKSDDTSMFVNHIYG